MEIDRETEMSGSCSGGGRGRIWSLDQKIDEPIKDAEAGHVTAMDARKELSAFMILRLAFHSFGVVYGDLGTSPLYVFSSTFPDGIQDSEDVMGALSLIIYTLTLIPLLKYVFVVMRANDNGEGGTFALYSLLCRHAKMNTIPNQHRTDEELTTYSRQTIKDKSFAARTKKWLEAKVYRKNALLLLVLIGTCMVIGDGIFTPAISGHASLISVVMIYILFFIFIGLVEIVQLDTHHSRWKNGCIVNNFRSQILRLNLFLCLLAAVLEFRMVYNSFDKEGLYSILEALDL